MCELQSSENSQGLDEREQITAQAGNKSLLFLGQVVGGLQWVGEIEFNFGIQVSVSLYVR